MFSDMGGSWPAKRLCSLLDADSERVGCVGRALLLYGRNSCLISSAFHHILWHGLPTCYPATEMLQRGPGNGSIGDVCASYSCFDVIFSVMNHLKTCSITWRLDSTIYLLTEARKMANQYRHVAVLIWLPDDVTSCSSFIISAEREN